MMEYTKAFFDQMPRRIGTNSSKWDRQHEKFGVSPDQELTAMWIADMDFYSPQEVREAVQKRAADALYGYTFIPDSCYGAIIDWVERRYGWKIEKEWIVFTPGVIPGFNVAFQSFSEEGDGILVQQPVYYPFMDGVNNNGRKLVVNELVEKDGFWTMDLEALEEQLSRPDTKIMIISNPHNPVGRAWTREELEQVGSLCVKHGVLLISDEIHADLMMKGHRHQPAAAISEEIRRSTITHFAPSKTFNLAGLQTAYAVIPDPEIRKRFLQGLTANRIINPNYFGPVALETAYRNCEGYVDALCAYVDGNMDHMKAFLETRLPQLKMEKSEATYMVWIDFRGTGMSTAEIEDFIVRKAHITVDMGSWFGKGGDGFLRFNLACPRHVLEKALEDLAAAFAG